MSFKLKTSRNSVRNDGATAASILVCTLVGIGLFYWLLVTNIILSVTAGAVIGAGVGWLIGRLIDKRLAPWIEGVVMNAVEKGGNTPRRYYWW